MMHWLTHRVATAQDPQDGEVAFGRVPAALRLNPRPAPEALPGLRVVQDRVRGVDRVLSVDVPALRRLPVLLDPGPGPAVTIHNFSVVRTEPLRAWPSPIMIAPRAARRASG